VQRVAERGGLDRFGAGDQQDVDEVLRARAGSLGLSVPSRIGMHLLGEVLCDGHCGDIDRLDLSEGEQVRRG
jgi:hypothetical protein